MIASDDAVEDVPEEDIFNNVDDFLALEKVSREGKLMSLKKFRQTSHRTRMDHGEREEILKGYQC